MSTQKQSAVTVREVITFNYICSECGVRFNIEPGRYVCALCSERQTDNQPLCGVLEVELQGTAVGNDRDIGKLLPVDKK